MSRGRKAWVHQKKDRGGWHVDWYDENNKRHSRQFPNKTLATQFANRKTTDINDDYHAPGAVPQTATWEDVKDEYRKWMIFEGCKPKAVIRRFLTIGTFEEMMKIKSPDQVTQATVVDYMVKFRSRETRYGRQPAEASVYAELAHLRAFINWGVHPSHRYFRGPFDLKQPPAPKFWRKPRSLRVIGMQKLLSIFNDKSVVKYPEAWRVRILLAAGAGLRRDDIEHLTREKFVPEEMAVLTKEEKTDKFTHRPVHPEAWKIIWRYVLSRPAHGKLFPDTHTSKKWERICKAIGAPYPGFRYHDLRITFTSSMQEAGVPTGVTQKLLNHSTSKLTNDVYTDFDPTLRPAIDRLPVKQWLQPPAGQQEDSPQQPAQSGK